MSVIQVQGIARWRRVLLGGMPPSKTPQSANLRLISRHQVTVPDMPRTHGYTAKGKRCFGTHDWQARGRINVIGALLGTELLTVGLFTGNINSDVLHGCLEDNLIPKLPPMSVLVMDNATFHKRSDTKNSIR